ncbi:MAG: hypothetical protein KDA53_09425 [Hyphomonas sp.]|nr:hypothetical protein [Hyphomonas sp.]
MRQLVASLILAGSATAVASAQEDCGSACLAGFEPSLFVFDDCGVTPGLVPEYPLHTTGEATCETSFLLDEEGAPYDIQADCSDARFVRSAERFASGLRYDVTNSAGNTCFVPGAIRQAYPIEYRLAED